jgi:hypothetical protein
MVVELIDIAHGERAAEPIRTVTSRASLHDDRCRTSPISVRRNTKEN